MRLALAALEAEGWRLRHSLAYGGRGDIDSVAIAPTGIAFAIEVKTRSFERGHLAAVENNSERDPGWRDRDAVDIATPGIRE